MQINTTSSRSSLPVPTFIFFKFEENYKMQKVLPFDMQGFIHPMINTLQCMKDGKA